MEESPILVVLESIVDLLVPYHSSVSRGDVDQFDPKSIANEIVREHGGSLKTGVSPFVSVRIGYV